MNPLFTPHRGQSPQHNAATLGPQTARHLLSKQELALNLGVSTRTIESWMSRKCIPFLRLSPRMVKFNIERVTTALSRYEVQEIGRRAA